MSSSIDKINQVMSDAINAQIKANHEAIEKVCEMMLTSNTYGVRVIYEKDFTVTVSLHPSVPYGELHEYRNGIRDDLR